MPQDRRYTAAHVANYIILLAIKNKVADLTPLKLIKLCYFSYAWYLHIHNRPLFPERPEAWNYGPVFPTIYTEFNEYGKNPIDNRFIKVVSIGESEKINNDCPAIDNNDKEAIDIIFGAFVVYKDKTGEELSQITHDNIAWKNAIKKGHGTPLDEDDIKEGASQGLDKIRKEIDNGKTY